MTSTSSTSGDRDNFILDRLALVQTLARSIKKRVPQSVDFDDLYQAGAVGLVEAVDRMTSAVADHAEQFVFVRIRGAMLDMLRNLRRGGSNMSTIDMAGTENLADDGLPDPSHCIEVAEEVDRVVSPLDQLTRELVRKFYGDNFTAAEIGRDLGLTEARARTRLRAAMAAMQARVAAIIVEDRECERFDQ